MLTPTVQRHRDMQLTVLNDTATLLHRPTGNSVTWFPTDDQAVRDGARHAVTCLTAMASIPSALGPQT